MNDDGTLRAFQNVCRHRGNSLCAGSGSDLRELRCGYHGWTWDLAGTLKRVPNRKGFGTLSMAEFPLFAVRVETWERLVFVNLDLQAPPLADYLEAVPDDIAWLGLGDFRCYATMTVEVDANWKTIADGFSETYHIQTLHPELHRCMDDVYAPQVIWGHTGKSEQLYGLPSPHLQQSLTDAEVWDAYVCTQGALMGVAEGTPFPGGRPGHRRHRRPDKNFRCRTRCRRELGQYRTIDATAPVQHLPELDSAGQRRPSDRDVLSPGTRSRPRRTGDDVVDAHAGRCRRAVTPADVRLTADQAEPGLVLTQDISVLAGLQRGLHQPGLTHLTLSAEERRVINMHRNLDRYLDLPERDRMRGGDACRAR